MRSPFWIFLLLIWIVSFLILLPATSSPWHGLERELLSAPTASLRSLDLGTIGKMAPSEFLGWWSLLEQRRFFPDPLTFRLVNLFLVSAMVLFFGLALAGENLRHLQSQPGALFAILPAVAVFAFHPALSDLVANAFARPILLAGFWGFISFLLLRRAFAEEAERPGALIFGVLFFLVALACHPAAAALLAPLVGPFLFRSQRIPRNWIVLLLLALVVVSDFGLGLVWAQSPLHFFRAEFFSGVPEAFRLKTISFAFFPVPGWPPIFFCLLLASLAILAPVFRRRKAAWAIFRTMWAWDFVYLLGLIAALASLQEAPGINLTAPIVLAIGGYYLIQWLPQDAIRAAPIARAAVACGVFIAACFLILLATRSWSYNRDLKRARAQVADVPAGAAAWRDYGLALVGDHRTGAGRAVLNRTSARWPEDLPTRLAMVEVAVEKNQPDEARTILGGLRKEAPERWEVVFHLCALAARQGEPAEAEGYCQAAVDERPASALALNSLATVRLRAGRLADASNLLDRAREREPRNASVLNNLGYLAEQKQDLGRALHFYREAADLDPQKAIYLKNLAHVYYLSQQIPQAITSLEGAVRVDPQDLQARSNLAQLLIQIQDLRRGQEQISTIIRLAPDSPEAVEMRRLLFQLGQTPPTRQYPGRRLR